MKILLCGWGGHMGHEVRDCAERAAGCEIVAGVDPMIPPQDVCVSAFQDLKTDADVIIDFSHHAMTGVMLDYAEEKGLPVVLATTGQTDEEKARIRQASEKIPIFLAANYSLGIAALTDLVKRAAVLYPDAEIEIIEQHHDRKIDAPSGTALMLARSAADGSPSQKEFQCARAGKNVPRQPKEIGIHAVRGGTVVGEHSVLFLGNNEVIELRHSAQSKSVFAVGAIRAARFLASCAPGKYDMNDLLG